MGIGQALALRNMGLILVIPVLPMIAIDLEGSSPFAVGLSIGAYGLTQAVLQLPFGWLSDRWGRRTLVQFGLLLFLMGNVMAGLAHHVVVLILGRALMGAGAIASVCNAWTADLIPPERRAQAFGVISLISSAAGFLGFLLGPILYAWFSLSHIFFLCAALTLPAAVGVVWLGERSPDGHFRVHGAHARGSSPGDVIALLRAPQALIPNLLGFLMNYFMTSLFFFLPLQLKRFLEPGDFWKVMTPSVFLGVLVMLPAMRAADRGHTRAVLWLGLGLEAMAGGILLWGTRMENLVASLFLFVAGYLLLAPTLPSWISRRADPERYGLVMGTYTMFIFLGSFFGASVAGLLYRFGVPWFSLSFLAMTLLGGLLVARMEDLHTS
jgi:MFS family permease